MNKYAIVDRFAYQLDLKRRATRANHRLLKLPVEKLTKKEIQEYTMMWRKESLRSCEFYKAFCGRYDSEYVPNDYYDYAEHVLNLRWGAFFLQHKCNLKYIIPERNRAKTILQKIDGHYVDERNVEMTESQAIEKLRAQSVFVYKIAMGTGGGKGVKRVEVNTMKEDELHGMLKPNDLLFQEVIQQHEYLSQFNRDSVNTFRMLTLNINGRCSVLSSFLRMGAKGSFVDNLCTGGGMLVGISQDGQLSSYGITKEFHKVTVSPAGIPFKGQKVPNWEEIKKEVVSFHQVIPYANLVGWDITLDEQGVPIVIEINLDSAEVEAHQIFNGPVFGDRLQEVRAYIEERKPMLRHAMITY